MRDMIAKEIQDVLPPDIRAALRDFSRQLSQEETLQELRLRAGKPLCVRLRGREEILPRRAGACTQVELDYVLGAATGQSIYSVQNCLQNGYITLSGGHRIGVCGTFVRHMGETTGMKQITSLNIRISHDIPIKIANFDRIFSDSLLIVGPPGSGKTTLLRACIRALDRRGNCISVVDERNELGAFDLGLHTDILCGCSKQEGLELLLRSMGPDWIAVDEISSENDVICMEKCAYCGVKILATAHANNISEMKKRSIYRKLLQTGIFPRALVLDKNQTFSEEIALC